MSRDQTQPLLSDAALFTKASPSVLRAVFPLRWLWRFFTRRFAVLRGLATAWNASEPGAALLCDGVMYGEGPRFRLAENAVYFTDMYAQRVIKHDLTTKQTSLVYAADDYVSGLGWLPDGRLLVVAMNSRRLLALDQATHQASEYADLTAVTRYRANDLVVDAAGRAFVGNFGFDFTQITTSHKTTLVRVDADRSVHVAATGLFFPNGSVVTPDGKTLIVAETFDGILTAFDVAADGALANRRVWADVGVPCDGIVLDAEGCVWVAVPHVGIHKTAGALVRVREGGEIAGLYGFGMNGIVNGVFACQLGTDAATGRHLLFFLEAASSEELVVLRNGSERAKQNGVLKAIEVAVGPARMESNDRYCGGYC